MNAHATKVTSTLSDTPGSPGRDVHKREDIILDIEWDPVTGDEEATEGHVVGYETTDSGI